MRNLLMRTNFIWIAALAAATLSGCATDRVSDRDAKAVPASRVFAFQPTEPSTANVLVTRDTGFVGGACNYGLKVDDTLTAAIGAGEQVRLQLPEGDHILSFDVYGRGLCGALPGNERSVATTIAPQRVRRFRITFNGNDLVLQPEATPK